METEQNTSAQNELSQVDDGAASAAPLSITTIPITQPEMQTKRCRGCGEIKPLSQFHKQKKGRLGHSARCKICVRQSIETRICQDCGKPIGNQAIRCRSCESRRRWAEGLNDGLAEVMRGLWAAGHYDGNSEMMKAKWARGDLDHLLSKEHRRKMSEGRRAWHEHVGFSDETRQKMSRSHKIAWASGSYDHIKALRKTPEYRQRMSEIKKAAWARGDYDNRKPRGLNQKGEPR